MAQLQDEPPLAYTNRSSMPSLGGSVSQSICSAVIPAPQPDEAGSAASVPPTEKRRKPSRTSSLLSSLSPPFPRRLGRALSVTRVNGKPVIDVHAALRSTSSKESNTTAASQSIGGGLSTKEGMEPSPPNGNEDVNDLEKANAITSSSRREDLTNSVKRLSRRVSDAGVRRVNSAIDSFMRRMGLGHDHSEATSAVLPAIKEMHLSTASHVRGADQAEGEHPGVDSSLPRADSGRGPRGTPSLRAEWRRSKALATDTFEFAAALSSSQNGNMRENYAAIADSPVSLREGDNRITGPDPLASNRESLHDTTTAPLRHVVSVEREEGTGNVTVKPSPSPRDNISPLDDISVPQKWIAGTEMYKVSEKGTKLRKFILDPDQGLILWNSKKSGIIRIENITELRPGSHARYNMEQLRHLKAEEDRWLTITYLADEKYQTLHIIAPTTEDFQSFYDTLVLLRELRAAMLSLPSNSRAEPPETGNSNDTEQPRSGDAANSPLPLHIIHRHLTNEQRQNLWERHYWKGAEVSVDGRIDIQELKRMAHKLSIDVSSNDLDHIFKEVHRSGGTGLNLEEFGKFWGQLRTRTDIQMLWNELASGDKFTFEGFEQFMRKEQKDTRSREDLKRIFAYYASTASDISGASIGGKELESATLTLTLEGFTAYLMSLDNAPFSDHNLGVHHDMDRPLSEYYISSSHNTYLVGHQLVGESTIEGYIRALLHSCRCVEIDIHDGDREPVITHGGTLTSKIPLRVICEAIEKNAFVTSPYPVIISAEVHCGIIQQHAIAEILKEVFKDKLVTERIDDEAPEPLKQLPSPRMLMNKILLKTKNPTISQGTAIDLNTEITGPIAVAETDASTGFTSDPEPHSPERRSSFSLTRGRRGSKSHALTPVKSVVVPQGENDTVGDLLDVSLSLEARATNLPKTKAFSQSLADLLVYTVGVKYRGINKKERYAVEHMFSLSERKADKMLKEGRVFYAGDEDSERPSARESVSGGMLDLMKHTQAHLVRIYPKGTRLKSTNYLPHRYWAAGAQLVAINWQTSDLGSMINQAMFLRNGKSGYVLKPVSLRPGEHKIKEVVSQRKTYALDLTIISAQQLPRPRDKGGRDKIDKWTMDPYVQVVLYIPDWPGVPRSALSQEDKEPPTPVTAPRTSVDKSPPLHRSLDCKPAASSSRYLLQSASTPAKMTRVQTDSVRNNGFNPSWQTCFKLKFEVAGDMLNLVFIRFSVRDEGDTEDDRALAMYCIPLGSLKQGYRHLPLHDQQMTQYLFSTLFIHSNLHEIDS